MEGFSGRGGLRGCVGVQVNGLAGKWFVVGAKEGGREVRLK